MGERDNLGYCPYQGLRPYSEEDAPFFFGREIEQEIIINNLFAARLTVLYGSSGVGKTSLLRAGVVRRLRELSRRNVAESGRPEFVVAFFNRWKDDDPAKALTRCLHNALSDQIADPPRQAFAEKLSLHGTLEAMTADLQGRFLIILDQFEEYILYHRDDDGEASFSVEFSRLVNDARLPVNFLISLRDDALARLDRFKGRVPNLFDNYLRIKHLSREAARTAIEKPIDKYNQLESSDEPKVRIEPELVDAVLDQLDIGRAPVGSPGRDRQETAIETPLLQLVLTRLWNEEKAVGSHTLGLHTFEALGGAANIARTHLDRAMANLSYAEREIAASLLRYLVTPSGTKIAQELGALTSWTELPEEEIQTVLNRLCAPDLRILKIVVEPGRPTLYEVYHDVLAGAILEWRRRYVQEEERQLAEQLILRERQRSNRLRWAMVGLTAIIVLMVGLTVFALQQKRSAGLAAAREAVLRQQAEAQRAITEWNSEQAQTAFKELAEQAQEDAHRSRNEADSLRAIAQRAQKEAEVQRQIAERARQSSRNANQ